MAFVLFITTRGAHSVRSTLFLSLGGLGVTLAFLFPAFWFQRRTIEILMRLVLKDVFGVVVVVIVTIITSVTIPSPFRHHFNHRYHFVTILVTVTIVVPYRVSRLLSTYEFVINYKIY